jgi:hypothetical protein
MIEDTTHKEAGNESQHSKNTNHVSFHRRPPPTTIHNNTPIFPIIAMICINTIEIGLWLGSALSSDVLPLTPSETAFGDINNERTDRIRVQGNCEDIVFREDIMTTLREWLNRLRQFDPDEWGEIIQLQTAFSEEFR